MVKSSFPYTRIISYGCSITAGSEMTDHDILGIPEDKLAAIAKRNNYLGSHQIYQHFSIDAKKRAEIVESNRTKSWPNYVAKHYGIPSLNRGLGGTSLQHATFRLLRDIHNGTIQPTDLIIVGITSPNRWFQFTSHGEPFFGVFGVGWEMLGDERTSLAFRTELEKNWYNLYNVVYSHYKEILFLSNLSDSMNGQIKLCYALGSPKYLEHFFSDIIKPGSKESEFMKFCNTLVDNKHFIYSEKSLSELAGYRDYSKYHTFGHPRVQYHEEFANLLIDGLEKLYNG